MVSQDTEVWTTVATKKSWETHKHWLFTMSKSDGYEQLRNVARINYEHVRMNMKEQNNILG
jgi:hypothetical protein